MNRVYICYSRLFPCFRSAPNDALQSPNSCAVKSGVSTVSDHHAVEDHLNYADVPVPQQSSHPANQTAAHNMCSIASHDFRGSTCNGTEHASPAATLPVNYGMTKDVPICRPVALTQTSEPADTSISANAFVSSLRGSMTMDNQQPVLGITSQNMCPPIHPSVWPTNFASNMLSSFGGVNMDALKSMLAAHLVPVLAGMMNNPTMVSGLLRMLGPTLPNSGVTPQLAAMFSQYLSSMIPSSAPVNQCNLSNENSAADVNVRIDPHLQPVIQSAVKPSVVVADRPSISQSVLLTGVSSAISDASSNSFPPTGASEKKSFAAFTNSAVTCNLIPLSSRVDLTSLPLYRHHSPAPSPVSIASDDADSPSDWIPDSDSESTRSRKRIRSRKTYSVRSSSVASSLSSKRSSCSSSRLKKRRKISVDVVDMDGIRFTCHRCPYATRCRNKFSKHIQLELSVGGTLDECTGEDRQPVTSDSPEIHVRQRCCYCAFSTFLPDEFSQHMKTHTVIKRYRCVYCSFAGYSSNEVKRHVSRVHPERPFAINRERQPAYRADVRTVDFDPSVRVADVLKLSHKNIHRLMARHEIDSIDFCI